MKLKAITVSGLPSNTYVSFVKVKKGSGKKAYKLLKVKKSNGKITVKKGTKKGTYKLKVKVTVTGANYNAYVKTITIKIKVK